MKAIAMLAALVCAAFATPAFALEGQCIDNYSKEGSFFSGRTFKSWGAFASVKPDAAFKKVYAQVVGDGFKISQADKEMGVIAAQQDVSGSSKTIPVNVLVAEEGAGTKVSVTVTTSGGLSVGEEGLQKGLCDIINAAEK